MKKKLVFFSAFILVACLMTAGFFVAFNIEKRSYFVSSGCDILSRDGKTLLYKVNYQYCHFMNDGSLLAYNAGTRMIYRFDQNYNLIWSKLHHTHHEFFVDEKNQRLYTFGSANHEYKERLTRFDTIRVIDIRTGDLLKVWDSFDQRKEILAAGFEKEYGYMPLEQQEFFQSPPYAAVEFSHFNSIQSIPANDVEGVKPSLKEGNLLICLNTELVIGVYNFEENKMIDFIKQDGPEVKKNSGIHDVKFYDRESIYYFRNTSPRRVGYVQIVRLNLKNNKREILYTGDFTAPLYGGADKTHDGGLLISYNEDGAKIIKVDLRTQKIVWNYKFGDSKFEVYRPRELELSSFLKNNHFLDPILTQN